MDLMNGSSTVHLNREHLSAQSMVRLSNPFVFRIRDESLSSDNYRNGLKLSLKCDNSFWVFSYWGANIEELHFSLDSEWQPMRQLLLDNKFLDGHYLFRSEPELYYETNEEIVHCVKCPNEFHTGEVLGYNPRSRYPLIVVIVRNDDDDGVELAETDVVCLVSVVHLRDSICTMTTSLITQYLKQRSGNMFNLQQIFTPEADADSYNSPLCVICQTSPVAYTILPCRHACLCRQCFHRVDTCPLCRSSIASCFLIGDETEEDIVEDNQTDVNTRNNSSVSGWFSSLNNKINHWLGMN